jgi:hypothetical protein
MHGMYKRVNYDNRGDDINGRYGEIIKITTKIFR